MARKRRRKREYDGKAFAARIQEAIIKEARFISDSTNRSPMEARLIAAHFAIVPSLGAHAVAMGKQQPNEKKESHRECQSASAQEHHGQSHG